MCVKKSVFSLWLIIVSSCNFYQEKGVELILVNNSDALINDVVISTSEKLAIVSFDKIKPNETKEGFLSMKNNKVDGAYTLSFVRKDGILINEQSGYYSNGSPLNHVIQFEIKNDTVLIEYGNISK